MKKASFFVSLGVVACCSLVSISSAATAKKPIKKPAPKPAPVVQTAPVVAPTCTPEVKTAAPVTAAPQTVTVQKETVVNNNTETIRLTTDSKISLLRNYLKLRDEISDRAIAIGDASGDCGTYVTTWNAYYAPQIENLLAYAKSQKADYIIYMANKDIPTLKNYLGVFKKNCLSGYKDPTLPSVSLENFDKKNLESYRAYLLEDFWFFSPYVMAQISIFNTCDGFGNEEWKYILKPRYEEYIRIANSLGMKDEVEYLNAYLKTASGYSKLTCNKNLD